MACVISAPSSGSGKTLLSILLCSWANRTGLKLQSFKAGPDYLDSQLLTAVSQRPCRNLDLNLFGENWCKESFHGFGCDSDLTFVEGVMGLFDGIGSSTIGSTAALARELDLPVILVIDARGQAASLGALIQGFKSKDPKLNIAGVVINKVNSLRHKLILEEVLHSINVDLFGCLPNESELKIESSHLGIAPQNEIENLSTKIDKWSYYAEKYLRVKKFKKLLAPPSFQENPIQKIITSNLRDFKFNNSNIAIAEDNAFHFRYQETQEILEALGMSIIPWSPLKDEKIPKDIRGIIIPGGFPEKYAEQISSSKNSINSIRHHFGTTPIYAECGGMLILGESLIDIDGKNFPMANLLPFKTKKGKLQVGYRNIISKKDSLIVSAGERLMGHEYHRWELINIDSSNNLTNQIEDKIEPPWEISGWKINKRLEGWSNKKIHASWLHLHWPSNINLIKQWNLSVNHS